MINASRLFAKGHPKHHLAPEHVEHIARLYHGWREEAGVSVIISNEEAARNDYDLSPSRCYVAQGAAEEVLPVEEAVVLLQEAEEERAETDRELKEVLARLGLEV